MFLKETLRNSKVPDFFGFSSRVTRESGQSTNPKTKLLYTALIDHTPSDPSTMMTTMTEAEKLMKLVRNVQYLQWISSYIV